ncbi:hypothetical protein Patl1_17166 [Pistacia atlantica]|uniref:Uncharacterized protein n=1 Tax=Pistacia atlantica TaxID=434234 RepID=A0ACC1BAI5_9ROSI|nr:hypothetical protein Patl1_17166 [Pistacia atlantica]
MQKQLLKPWQQPPPLPMESENVTKVGKAKGRAGSKKAPVKKLDEDDDDDEDVPDLKKRLAKLNEQLASTNLESSPDQSTVMETDMAQVPAAKKKEPSKRNAARRKPQKIVSDTSESEDEIVMLDDDDEDFEAEEIAAPEAGKKGGRKAAKPPAATKKRGPSGQQAAASRSRPEAFNRNAEAYRSLSREETAATQDEEATGSEETSGSPSISDDSEEVIEVVPAKARPQRANRRQAKYAVSDSESEPTDDSDFNEDED